MSGVFEITTHNIALRIGSMDAQPNNWVVIISHGQ